LVLIPFSFPVEDMAQRIYDIATDILIWVPVSALWVWSCRKTRAQTWVWTVLAATLLESMQFLVYSRVTDVTDILMAAVGAGLGAAFVHRNPKHRGVQAGRPPGRHYFLWGITGMIVWSAVLAAVFWYPFNFDLQHTVLVERLSLLKQVPFYNYYYGTEFRAITEVLHKLTFFAPLGACLAYARQALPASRVRTGFDILAYSAFAAIALTIELGQVALPGKHPDSTDWMLETLGAVSGYLITLYVLARRPGAS
jgi:glycopeptide antibiotics resistance protein